MPVVVTVVMAWVVAFRPTETNCAAVTWIVFAAAAVTVQALPWHAAGTAVGTATTKDRVVVRPVTVSVTVTDAVEEPVVDGVPEIAPVEASMLSPAGSPVVAHR